MQIEYDEPFVDETLSERLWALTEMFPGPVRSVTSATVDGTCGLTKTLYTWSRVGLWVLATSFSVLILPIICEQEMSGVAEQQAMQQRQLLLGPGAAVSGGSGSGSPMSGMPFGMPQVAPVAAK